MFIDQCPVGFTGFDTNRRLDDFCDFRQQIGVDLAQKYQYAGTFTTFVAFQDPLRREQNRHVFHPDDAGGGLISL